MLHRVADVLRTILVIPDPLKRQLRFRAQRQQLLSFKSSPRPGTTAIDRFEDDVPEDVKRRRNNELLAVQRTVAFPWPVAVIVASLWRASTFAIFFSCPRVRTSPEDAKDGGDEPKKQIE